MRTVHGIVDTTPFSGHVVSGTGFSVKRTGVGEVVITFDRPFQAPPTVVFGDESKDATTPTLHDAPSKDSIRVVRHQNVSGGVEGTFHFLAIEG